MINVHWSEEAVLSFWSGFLLARSKLTDNLLYHQISMGLEHSWVEQGLTLPPGFNQEEVEAFWRTYNLKRDRKYAEHIDKDATREGLISALSAMEYRVVKFQNIKLHQKRGSI